MYWLINQIRGHGGTARDPSFRFSDRVIRKLSCQTHLNVTVVSDNVENQVGISIGILTWWFAITTPAAEPCGYPVKVRCAPASIQRNDTDGSGRSAADGSIVRDVENLLPLAIGGPAWQA